MTGKEINIKSSTIEKGLELAKEFLSKLISPTIEEVGLLVADNVKYLRFKNQVRILLKAKNYVDKNKISTKEIPIKILVPLLENASLEEDEELQEKWAKMIVNMIDSEINLQNQIFPYILSQISIEEFKELKDLFQREILHIERKKWLHLQPSNNQVNENHEVRKIRLQIDLLEQEGFSLELRQFEISNLLRLGLIRQLPPKIQIEEFSTGSMYENEYGEKWHSINAEYDPDNYGYRITELGEKFINICELKTENASH